MSKKITINEPEAPSEPAAEDDAGAQQQAIDPDRDRSENQTVDSAPAGDDDVSQLRRERDEYYDRLLRKAAEFDNYRKRVERDRRDQHQWAAAEVLTDLLAVIDDLERALKAEAPPEAEPYRAGFELIHRQLADLLRKRGASPIDAVGVDFDPHVHQAVAYEETPGAREGEVVAELRKGYKLGDRLLRPAFVKVAKAS
jgi:molecular chaperone GrpE